MLQYKVFKVSCFLLIWTRIDYGLTIDTSTAADLGGRTPVPKNSINEFSEELDETKTNEIDATVRNFFPVKGKQKWMRREFPPVTEMLFFNLTVIGDNEEVTLAQLHLHRRRLTKTHTPYHKKYLPSPYRVVLYQIQPNYRQKSHKETRTMKLASIPVSHLTKGGWHTLDVTAVVRELLINAQGPVELLFGVHFEAPKRLDKPYSPLVPLKHFLKSPGVHTPEHPYKSSSYLVVFSEKDPYFEEFEESETPTTTSNLIPTQQPDKHSFKERHLKHKILKGKNNDNDSDFDPVSNFIDPIKKKPSGDAKNLWKYKKSENEVLKNDVIRHKGKHRGSEVKRSKADELALKERTKLKSLPFLHANEVEEIRQTSRRLTRSSGPLGSPTKPKDRRRRRLINAIKGLEWDERESDSYNENSDQDNSTEGMVDRIEAAQADQKNS